MNYIHIVAKNILRSIDVLMTRLGCRTVKSFTDDCVYARCRKPYELASMNELDNKEHLFSDFCSSCQRVVFDNNVYPPGTDTSDFYASIDTMNRYIHNI